MGNKDPAVLLYTADFLIGSNFMTDEQVGKYIRLLCNQHQVGHLSEKQMMKICKTHDEDIFSKFLQDEDGLYYNKRMDIEIHKRQKYSESRSLNRSGKNKPKDIKNICNSYEEHMENENENEIISNKVSKKDIEEFYESVWKLYPKKEGKGQVSLTQKKKLHSIGLEEMTRAIERYVKAKQGKDKQYLQNGSTFFNSGYVDYLDANYQEDKPESLYQEI
jgi:uncharacterized protein YdaU (DUF1376 family)